MENIVADDFVISDCLRVWRLESFLCFWFSSLGTSAPSLAFQESQIFAMRSLRMILLMPGHTPGHSVVRLAWAACTPSPNNSAVAADRLGHD
jgi:glyoxylase-like metal-dependent hydrolase (beta-lactamase superfamily II)